MTTRSITLTNDWQQITERGQYGLIQVTAGIAYLCESETQPGPEQAAHPRAAGDINYGDTVIWGRSYNGPVSIIVSSGPN